MTHFTTYWKDDQVSANLGEPINYAASEQFSKVQVGDVVWIVNIQTGTGAFRLIGKIVVDAVLDEAGMERRYPGESLYDASLFACAVKGQEERGRTIPIDSHATEIRFEGASPTLELRNGKVYAQQVRRLRTLTSDTASLFEEIWLQFSQATAPIPVRGNPPIQMPVRLPVFWWVNQNQTARQEVGGGYMWSPKRNKNGARNAFYENMRECAPGDVVFSFVDTKISTLGVVTTFCEESPKPNEFGTTGDQWDADGWRVGVAYRALESAIRPVEHMEVIRPTLPEKYSPLQADGRGNQVYLARVPQPMAEVLIGLIGDKAHAIIRSASGLQSDAGGSSPLRESRDIAIEKAIQADDAVPETEKQSLIKSRRGQGLFRERVAAVEPRCRVSGVENPSYRIASHIKPWSKCTNQERLDADNGLLLAPHIDHLFDNGFISFDCDGTLLISPAADSAALRQMGVPVDVVLNVGPFNEKQKTYLTFHRNEVFKKATTSGS